MVPTRSLTIISIALILCGFLINESVKVNGDDVFLRFFDVGQGDGAMITTPSGKQIVIDGGPDLRMLEYLGTSMPYFDRSIDLLIMTHPNLDHFASFPSIIERYDVHSIMLPLIEYELPLYEGLLTQLAHADIRIIPSHSGTAIAYGDGVAIDVLWPEDGWFQRMQREDPNDASTVVRITYGDHSALFTGDISSEIEDEIMRTGAMIESDILKVGHHGSRYSSSTGFLLEVNPKVAVISVGAKNSFNHPHPSIVDRLNHLHIPIKRTDLDGTVDFRWK